MARTATISPNPASRVWHGRCAPRSPSIRVPRARCRPPRVRSAASFWLRRRTTMPVYTVHAPTAGGAAPGATDKFVFVRDGFHFWAMIFGPFWLVWNRLWLATIGWIIAIVALDIALAKLGAGRMAIFSANVLVALLMGF